MGNINNIWYLKDSGGDWASTKCELDDCYSITFNPDQDDSLYLQVDMPNGYGATEVWLTDLAGNQLQEILAFTDWKIVVGENTSRLIFKVPQNSYACKGIPEEQEVCILSLYDGNPINEPYVDEWLVNPFSTQIYVILNTTTTIDFYEISAGQLPSGWTFVSPFEIQVACDAVPDWAITNIVFVNSTLGIGNHTGAWPLRVRRDHITVYVPLNCFRFEVPLINAVGVVENVLMSEPFHCPNCEETLKLSSNYCLAKTDIFGTFVFDASVLPGTHYGGLNHAKNDMRIQAVLKKMPSTLKSKRNVRCNNFKSKMIQRYKLQGSFPTDFPNYMVNIIESIFSGKHLYINGEEYIPDSDTIFTERNVAGRSMKRLEAELTKCEQAVAYTCDCEPPSCEDNPINYNGIVFCTPAPDQGYGVDRSIWRFSIDPSAITGGVTPYEIYDWQAYICEGTISPHNAFSQPWSDSSDSNFYRRGGSYNGDCRHIDANNDGDFTDPGDTNISAGCSCLSVLVKIKDHRGCVKQLGNTVDIDDLRCVGQDGNIVLSNITNNSVDFISISPFPGGATFDLTFDGTNYPVTGVSSLPYTLSGLTAGTEYRVKVRINCGGGSVRGYIGPVAFTTLP